MAVAAVHPATPADVAELARIQVDTWRAAYAEILPEQVLAALDTESVTDAIGYTVANGPAKVWVATEGVATVGFCVAGPAPADEVAAADGAVPPDAAATVLVSTLLVEPRWGRRGHGGRLLATAATALREVGATRGISWVPESDEASRAFYSRVGWESDATVRTLDAAGRPLREVRLTGGLNLELA